MEEKELTNEEINALISLINIAIKTEGLAIAETSLYLVKKLQNMRNDEKSKEG